MDPSFPLPPQPPGVRLSEAADGGGNEASKHGTAKSEERRREAEELAALQGNGGKGLIARCLRELAYENYAEYLKTEHWHTVRTAALKRAGYRCEIDLSHKGQLDVHHITYERIGEEWPGDVLVACHDCHATWHETRRAQALAQMRDELR